MARKLREKNTDIIYDDDLVDMIDEKLDNEPVVKSSMRDVDEADAVEDAFEGLDLDEYITDSKDTTKVAPAINKRVSPEPIKMKPAMVKNPFEQTERESKPTYNDIIEEDFAPARMDVRPYTPVPVKKSKRRFKLWLVSGICGLTLLFTATLIGVLGVGAGAGTNAMVANNVETGELASDQGIINKTDSNLTDEQVKDWLSGGKNLPKNVRSGKASSSSTDNSDIITNSSMWDKVCDFFSRLFGR